MLPAGLRADAWASVWLEYDRGRYLRAGGAGDQDALYLEAMQVVSAEVARVQRRDAERRPGAGR